MTDELERVLQDAKSWSPDDRAELLEFAHEIEARRTRTYVPTPEEHAAIEEGLAQARRGEFVSDEDMKEVWARLRA